MKLTLCVISVSVLLFSGSTLAETSTTTPSADGTEVVVEETTTTPEETEVSPPAHGKIIGPAGVTGTIRRSGRRQGRRGDDVHIQN